MAERDPRPSRAVLLAFCAAICAVWSAGGPLAQRREPLFVDATGESGLAFTHVNGSAGELLLPEVIGAGGALFDYDNDGDLDLFAVQGAPLRDALAGRARAPHSRLFRNDLTGSHALRFTDVTAEAGLAAVGYGMGAATGDYDNDGWIDLYVTYLGSNRLFRNLGGGRFADVTPASGTSAGGWSTSATFVDYDRDGWLDLFVARYVSFHPDMKRACFSASSARDYCNPAVYEPVADRLFRNNGNGTFTDVSVQTGIGRVRARGLGVLAADVNDDGWPDLYVANDGDPNHLWINGRGSGFTDEGLLAGVAVSRAGQAQGGMGVDAGDVDGDGDEDLFVTNLDNESNTMYLNTGGGLFEDRTSETGLFRLGLTGFGARLVDFDRDGRLDLAVVNGAVRHLAAQIQRGDAYPLKQPNLLFRYDPARRRFVDATREGGPGFTTPRVGRGLAAGDVDNDGDTDLVVFNNNGPARVLLNHSAGSTHWLGIRAVDARRRRDAHHARVDLVGRGGVLRRRVQTDGSYGAASDPRIVFGLGADGGPQTVRVHWPGGRVEEYGGLLADRYWVVEAGQPPRGAASP